MCLKKEQSQSASYKFNEPNKERNADLVLVTDECCGVAKQRLWTISVYLDDGRVFEYDVTEEQKVREHASAIATTGYRHCDINGTFEHYPPHRILKIKSTGIFSSYPDRVRGT